MDLIKDLWYTFLKLLTKNETYEQKITSLRRVLSLQPSTTRFILAMAAQTRWHHRSYYKRIQNGSVKGVWYAHNAASKSERQLASAGGPVIMFIHGGAFLAGQCKMWSDWAVAFIYAHKQKYGKEVSIFFVDYTLAPDRSFPCQWHECRAGYDYLVRTLHVDPARLFISGDSAGGNLALQTMFELDRAAQQSLAGAVLFSPFVLPATALVLMGVAEDRLKLAPTMESTWHTNAENDYITDTFGTMGVKAYIGSSMKYQDAYSSPQINPCLRTPAEVGRLPDMLVLYGEGERLRDQIVEWVDKAKESTTGIEVFSRPGAVHDWPLSPDYCKDPADFNRAIECVGSWIEKKMVGS